MATARSMPEHFRFELVLEYLRHMVHGRVENGDLAVVTLK